MIDRPLRIVTWNVHMGVGRDGRRDLQRIARKINRFDADILALQEVENLAVDHPEGNELEVLARATGLRAEAGPTMLRPDGEYGNAVLTRWPVRRVRRHDISVAGREPRGVLELEVEIAGSLLRVLATHLGLRRRERQHQLQQLCGLVDADANLPLALLGDLNIWNRFSSVLRPLQQRFPSAPLPRTFPSGWPLFPLDRIFLRGVDAPRVWTFDDRLIRAASDHLPLAAEVHLPE